MPSRIRSVIFLGRKPGAVRALQWLLDRGFDIRVIVTKEETTETDALKALAEKNRIPFFTDDASVYEMIGRNDERVANTDLVISYLFWKKIRAPLYTLPQHGCINFHPAPLPDYKGRAGYNTAILDRRTEYGVSAHHIDSEDFDSGPIIKVLRFSMDPDQETAHSLERVSQEKLLELFVWTMQELDSGRSIEMTKNEGGVYLTQKQLEELSYIDPERDSPEEVHRKIRAFFFPPYSGAKIFIKGEGFTLINDHVLTLIRKLIDKT